MRTPESLNRKASWQGAWIQCVSWEGGADLVGNNTGGRLNAMYTAAQQQHLSRQMSILLSTALIRSASGRGIPDADTHDCNAA